MKSTLRKDTKSLFLVGTLNPSETENSMTEQ